MTRRVIMSLCGVIICGVAIGIFKIAALGVDPFQSLLGGFDQISPISFGMLSMLVNIFLLSFSLFADRHNIGLATFINLFLLGYITQFVYAFLQTIIVDPPIAARVAYLMIGLVVLCFASSLYMTADLGVSTYDAVAIVMAYKWKLGKFKYIRICTDLVCVTLGTAVFILGGGTWRRVPTIVGVGTIITAFFMGPLIEFFNVKIARPLLGDAGAQSPEPVPGGQIDAASGTCSGLPD